MANPAQIKKIHVLKSLLKLDDETYRSVIGKPSSKDLSFNEAMSIIDKMEKAAVSAALMEKRPVTQYVRMKFDELGHRPGYATPAQLRKIDAMWAGVSREHDTVARVKALNHFLEKHFGVSRIEWVEMSTVSKIITALYAMQSQKERKESHDNVQQSHRQCA